MLYKAIYVVYIYVGLILQLFGGMKLTLQIFKMWRE